MLQCNYLRSISNPAIRFDSKVPSCGTNPRISVRSGEPVVGLRIDAMSTRVRLFSIPVRFLRAIALM